MRQNTDISTLVEKIGVDFSSLNALLAQSTNGGDSVDSHHVSAYDGLSLVSSKIKEPLGEQAGVFKQTWKFTAGREHSPFRVAE